jgi:hypothetical protein
LASDRPTGRPRIYNPEIADTICERLKEGQALIAICRDEAMPASSTVRSWVDLNIDGFSAKYAKARDFGLDQMAEEIMEIADDDSNDLIETPTGTVVNGAAVARARLKVDTRKWILSKLAPKRYSDRLATDLKHIGNVDLATEAGAIHAIRLLALAAFQGKLSIEDASALAKLFGGVVQAEQNKLEGLLTKALEQMKATNMIEDKGEKEEGDG